MSPFPIKLSSQILKQLEKNKELYFLKSAISKQCGKAYKAEYINY